MHRININILREDLPKILLPLFKKLIKREFVKLCI